MGLKIGTKEFTDEDSTTVCCTSDGHGGDKRLRELYRRVTWMERDFPGGRSGCGWDTRFPKAALLDVTPQPRFTSTESRISRCTSAENNRTSGVRWLMQTKVLQRGERPDRDVSNRSGDSSQKSLDLDKFHERAEIISCLWLVISL